MEDFVTDEQLVLRSIEGDREAFAALVSRHYDFIFKVAWKFCGNRPDAEDVAQDVCMKLGRGINSWSRKTKFSTWVYRVVLNSVKDARRRNVTELRKRDAWFKEPGRADVHYDGPTEEDHATQELWAAVRQLPEKQCAAIMLIFGEGLTHSDAAKVMECAEGTVSSHIHDAKKKLKILVRNEETESAGIK